MCVTSCLTTRFTTSNNLGSKFLVNLLCVWRKKKEFPDSREFAKEHLLQWLDTRFATHTTSRSPDGASVLHHRTDDLLIKQHIFSAGQTTSKKARAKHAHSLSCISSTLVDVCRRDQLRSNCHPDIRCCFDPLYWLSEKLG
jgi:hypothetical protein